MFELASSINQVITVCIKSTITDILFYNFVNFQKKKYHLRLKEMKKNLEEKHLALEYQ
jgi:hypothetical protein